MEEHDQQQAKVDQARNELEGFVHECDMRLKNEWHVAVQSGDRTVRHLKYHLEEARSAIRLAESDLEVCIPV